MEIGKRLYYLFKGAVFGMMCEYLYRVESSTIPVTLTVLLFIGILASLVTKD